MSTADISAKRTLIFVSVVRRERDGLSLSLISIYPNAVVSRLMRALDASGPPAEQIPASK